MLAYCLPHFGHLLVWGSLMIGLSHGFLTLSYSAGGGRGSVEAWYTSALDIEEVLSGAVDSHIPLFVADVIKSFDTVDRGVLDAVLCSLGLPGWFRHAYFEYHAHVRLRFKLAAGLGEPWTRDVHCCFVSTLVSLLICSGWCWASVVC